MTNAEEKATLRHYLQSARDALVWKLDGLDERQVRWPLTPTGTNLLGLVKHAAGTELGYFGEVFGRIWDGEAALTWLAEDAPANSDMWATAEESTEYVVELYRQVWAFADETIEQLDLDAPGRVPWWGTPDVTLHRVLVHMIAELERHAGHADIVRELTDGAAGLRAGGSNLPDLESQQWGEYVVHLREVAESFAH